MMINLEDVYGSKVLTGTDWIKQSTSYVSTTERLHNHQPIDKENCYAVSVNLSSDAPQCRSTSYALTPTYVCDNEDAVKREYVLKLKLYFQITWCF